MSPKKFGYAAIALALLSMPILTGCGQGQPLPPVVGGPLPPGAGGCIPITGMAGAPGTMPSMGGGLNLPISFTGAQYTPHNRRISAGRMPTGAVPPSGYPAVGTGSGQVIVGGAGAMPTVPAPGGFGPTQQWVGMDYRYGGIQISFQPMNIPTMDPNQGYYGYNPYFDAYGLPLQASQVNGGGVIQLNAIAMQDIQNLVMQSQYGNFGPYSQNGFWPNQPGYMPMQPTAPMVPQSVCISEVAFTAAIAVGRTPSLWLGNVWIYVNMMGGATTGGFGPRGIYMLLN